MKEENKIEDNEKDNNDLIKEKLNNDTKFQIKFDENNKKKNGVIKKVNNIDLDTIKNLSIEDKERNKILMNKLLNKDIKINEIIQLIKSPNSMRIKRNKKNSNEKSDIFIIDNSYYSDSYKRKNSSFSPKSETKLKNRSKYNEIFDQINKMDFFNMKRKTKIISYSKNNYKSKDLFNSNLNYPKKNYYSTSFSFLKNNFSPSQRNNKNNPNLKRKISIDNNNDFLNIKTNKCLFNNSRNRNLNNINFDDQQLSYYYKNELLKLTLMLKKGYTNKIHFPNFTCKNSFLNNYSKKFEKKECIEKLKNW